MTLGQIDPNDAITGREVLDLVKRARDSREETLASPRVAEYRPMRCVCTRSPSFTTRKR